MNAKMQYAVPDWVALGDTSKYEFIKWLSDTDCHDAFHQPAVWVQYGNEHTAIRDGDEWLICSRKMLPNTTVFFQSGAFALLPTEERFAKYLIFQEFPFVGKNTMELIEQIRSASPDAVVLTVLMDVPRRFGSTDDTPAETGILKALESYRSKGCPVISAKNGEDLLKILNWQEPLSDRWNRMADQELEVFKERIECIEYDYQELLHDLTDTEDAILSLHTAAEVCSLKSVKTYQFPYIWDNFTEAFVRRCFPGKQDGGLYPVVDFYKEIIEKSPLAQWNAKKDGKAFAEELKNELLSTLGKDADRKQTFPLSNYNQDDFLSTINRGCKVDFLKATDGFVKERTLQILKHRLERKYKKMKEALS